MAIKVWDGSASGDWGTAANWTPAATPVNGDEIWIDGAVSNVDITAGLDQNGVTLDELHITDTYTGKIAAATTYLQISATLCHIGEPSGITTAAGSQRIKVDLGSNATNCVVYKSSATSADSGLEPIRLAGNHGSNILTVLGGTVGLGTDDASEVGQWPTLGVSGSPGNNPRFNIGAGITGIVALDQNGGTLLNRGASVTTHTMTGGEATVLGSATVTTLNLFGGAMNYLSNGTITTLSCSGEFTTERDPRPKTISNVNLFAGAAFNIDTGNPLSVTLTNGIDLENCGVSDVTLNLGRSITLAVTAA